MPKTKSVEETAEKIVKRIKNELNERGVSELPIEDFDVVKAEISFNALLNSGMLDSVIIKKKN